MRINAPRKRIAQRRATQIPKINRRSSLAYGCTGLWVPVGYYHVHDISGMGLPYMTSPGNLNYAYRELGPSFKAVSAFVNIQLRKTEPTAGTAKSVFFVGKVIDTSFQGAQNVMLRGAYPEYFSISVQYTPNNDFWRTTFSAQSGGTQVFISTATNGAAKPVAGGVYCVVGTYDRNAATRGHIYVHRLDNGNMETASDNTDVGADWDDTFATQSGSFSSYTTAGFLGGLWNRKLSEAEAYTLLMDPFHLIAEERQTRLRAIAGVPIPAPITISVPTGPLW